jgi:hypothetical protein
MANVDAPRGFSPLNTGSSSGSFIAQATRVFVPATDGTAIFINDAVKLAGSGDTAGTAPTVTQWDGTGSIYGVVVGVEPLPLSTNTSDDLTNRYRAASTAQYLYVLTDPNIEYEIQEDSVGSTLAVDDIGQNAAVAVAAGDTASGYSKMELDSSSKATTATLALKILRLVDRIDNAIGDNASWVVKINNHALSGGTGTAGV